jgi:hypothetical protein
MDALMRLTTELLDAAGGLAATAPDMHSGIAASAADQLEGLGPTLDTPAGRQQLVDLLERTAQDVLATQRS